MERIRNVEEADVDENTMDGKKLRAGRNAVRKVSNPGRWQE